MGISKVTYEFDPFDLVGVDPPVSSSTKQDALKDIGEFIVNEIRSYCADGSSPVSGGSWKVGLSPAYKKRKIAEGGEGFANLELKGDLMDALDYKADDTLEVGVWGSEAPKADGHNNFSGDSELPPREFIPNDDKGQTFKRNILDGIRRIAEEYADDGG